MKVDYSRELLEAIPLPVFLVDEDVRILDFNPAASRLMNQDREVILNRRGGEMMHCLHSRDVEEGCGRGPRCGDCVIRNSVGAALRDGGRVREKAILELRLPEGARRIEMMVTAAPVNIDGRHLVLLILEDISELMDLRRLLPICANCKKIRDDQAYWHSLESYMTQRLHLDLTHGICPSCAEQMLAEVRAVSARTPFDDGSI